jgi:hypothetical protein
MADSSTLFKVENRQLVSPDRSIINFEREVLLDNTWCNGTQVITIPAASLVGIKLISISATLYNGNQSSGTVADQGSIGMAWFKPSQLRSGASCYVGAIANLTDDVAITNTSFGMYVASYKLSLLANGDITIANANKGYFTKDGMAYVDRMTNTTYGFRGIIGYREIPLADCPTNAEMAAAITDATAQPSATLTAGTSVSFEYNFGRRRDGIKQYHFQGSLRTSAAIAAGATVFTLASTIPAVANTTFFSLVSRDLADAHKTYYGYLSGRTGIIGETLPINSGAGFMYNFTADMA